MAHHGTGPFDDFNNERFADQWKKSMPADQADRIDAAIKKSPMSDLGATNKFPDGKLNDTDEGEIMVGITSVEDRVVINFGKPVHWVGFTKEQAKQIAESLLKHSA